MVKELFRALTFSLVTYLKMEMICILKGLDVKDLDFLLIMVKKKENGYLNYSKKQKMAKEVDLNFCL